MFEEFGFERDRKVAKWRWVMRLTLHGVDPEVARTSRTVDVVTKLALEYRADEGDARVSTEDAPITRVEDLYDDATGLPR